MKPTRKARVVKPQSKKKIGKPLSKFTKVQSTSTLSKLEDTGKNFYEAGKEVANKGTDLLKQISAVPEKGLSEVVKMAIKAEQDAVYGRKVVMILGMILSTLMFLFTRLGQDYGFKDDLYDKKLSLPQVSSEELMVRIKFLKEIKNNKITNIDSLNDKIKSLQNELVRLTTSTGTSGHNTPVRPVYLEELNAHIKLLNETRDKFEELSPGSEKSAFISKELTNNDAKITGLEKELSNLTSGFLYKGHSVWSVAASALALTLLGRAAFMNKKEQFYYFVDFIIAFLVCSVVYFILVGIFGNKKDKDAFITNDSFFDKKDAATGYAVETFNAAYNGIASVFTSKKAVSVTSSGVVIDKKVSDPVVTDTKVSAPEVTDTKVSASETPSLGGKKRSKRRNKVTRGGMSTGISTQTVLVALTGVLAAIVLTSEKRRNIFSERLNKMIQYIKNNVSSKKEIV